MGICWDTKKVNDFIEHFEHAIHNYMEPLAAANAAYEKYENNETFVGQAAEKSKTFIAIKQKEFNRQQYNLSKEMLKKYTDLDETFKAMVDPAADARIDTDVVKKVQTRFQGQLEGLERSGFNIQQKSMEIFDRLSKYGCGVEEVYFRNTIVKYDDYCSTGGFLHNCIKKMEDFDDEASRRVVNSGLKDAIIEHTDEVTEKTAGLDSIKSQAVEIDKHTLSLVALGTGSTLNSINLTPKLMASNKISLVSPRYKTPRKFSLVKKKYSISNLRENSEKNKAKYIESMKKTYGFSKDEAELLNEAYLKHCENCEGIEKMSNRERANSFYTALACLHSGYSFSKKEFRYIGDNGFTPEEAIAYFDSIGVDGKALYDAINNQHYTCEDNKKRDFVHECAIYSVMANDNICKTISVVDDNMGDLVGFKGDVYSGSMGIDDKMSDVSAYNIYYRMKRCEDGDVWNAMVEYNIDANNNYINESLEFLQNLGHGNAKAGMSILKDKLNFPTFSALTITAYSDEDFDSVNETKEDFINYISKESGIDR